MTHVIVENQVALGEAFPVQSVLFRLMEEGLDRHNAIHAISFVLAERLFDGLTEKSQPADLNAEAELTIIHRQLEYPINPLW